MRVKTFQGRTLEELLPQVREELGPDAVVLSQRPLISGGVGGFFGKRLVEVTAADRMPSDEELIGLEAQFNGSAATDETASEPAARPESRGGAASISSGLPAGIDIVDDWDPATDAELAQEFGSVLRRARDADPGVHAASFEPNLEQLVQHMPVRGLQSGPVPVAAERPELAMPTENRSVTSAGTYEPLMLPRRQPTVDANREMVRHEHAELSLAPTHGPAPVSMQPMAAYAANPDPGVPAASDRDPMDDQARELADRAHQAIAAATREIERQIARSDVAARSIAPGTSTFRAEVMNAPAGPRLGFPQPAQAAAADLLSAMPISGPMPVPAPSEPHDYLIEPAQAPTPETNSARRMGHHIQVPAHQPSVVERARESAVMLADMLVDAGVERDVADLVMRATLVHRLPFVDSSDLRGLLREVVAEIVSVQTGWQPLGRAHRMALVGPSGAGKSTIAAKLAQGYERGIGMRVGVISVLAGVHAHPPSHALDPLLSMRDIDLQFAADIDQMVTALDRVHDRDLVIIDTPSAAYLDRTAAASVAACLSIAKVDEVHAVIPLATSLREAESVIEHFRGMAVNRLVVSKLDESRYAGQLLNFGYRLGLPITFLSDGPAIPEDLRAASSAEIAALIVPHGDDGPSDEGSPRAGRGYQRDVRP